jgi:hypothetical protein
MTSKKPGLKNAGKKLAKKEAKGVGTDRRL